MLEFKDFVYLDLQKTGCTFLRDILKRVCVDPPVRDMKHVPLPAMPDKPRLMTIRSPLDYFLSLWKYGLDRRGGFYATYHASHPMAYAERSRRSFRCFLNLALTAGSIETGGQSLRTDIYTLRIINQLVPVRDRKTFATSLDGDLSPRSLMASLARYLPEVMLRTESLNRDFHVLADDGKLDFIHLRSDWKELFPVNAQKTNFSSGGADDSVAAFYDEWHREMVLLSCGLATALHDKATVRSF